MSSLLPSVTYTPLVSGFTTIDQKTITLWAQVTIGAGVYELGGIPAGLQTLAGSLSVIDTDPLWFDFRSENQVPQNGTFYTYRYIPALDYLQIFSTSVGSAGSLNPGSEAAPTELSSSSVIPAGVLNDLIVMQATYNRLPSA